LIAVCGATGELGRRVAARLSERGARLRMIVRDPGRAPHLDRAEVAVAAGYHDTDEMAAALRAGILQFNCESEEELDQLSGTAKSMRRRAPVAGS
jgi:uncharacterized protein YbjT (DUF2867 family)